MHPTIRYQPVWIDDNGGALCVDHAGAELQAILKNSPGRLPVPVQTSRGTWDVIDALTARDHDVRCEVCHAE